MDQKRKHRSRRKSIQNQKHGFDRFFSSKAFIALGVVFITIGLYFSIGSSEDKGSFYDILMNAIQPTNAGTEPEIEFSGKGLWVLLLYFVPAILTLTISGFYALKYKSITYPATIIIILYLFVMQVKVLMLYLTDETPSFFIAVALSLLLPALLLFVSAYFHRKQEILNLTSLYIFISVVIYTYIYGKPYDYLLPLVLLLSGGFFWVGHKINRPSVNLVNFFFASGFSGLFWARNFILYSKTDTLLQFFIIGILFYLLFYAVTIFASQSKEQPLRAWKQMVLGWSNLVFFVGTTSFVLVKYYSFGYLWVFVLAVLLLNVAGIYAMKKYKSGAWELPHYFAVLFLASLVLPLLLQQHMVLLFTAGLAAGMMVYTIKFKIQSSMWLSILAMGAMLVTFLFSWLFSYLSAFIPATELLATALLWEGAISGLVVVLTLSVLTWYLDKDVEIPLSKQWFSKTRYNRIIRTTLLIVLFITMGRIGFALALSLTGTLVYSPAGWFIAGSVFFIALITYFSGKQSIFKKPVLYSAFTFALLYPLLVYLGTRYYITGLIVGRDSGIAPLLLHYVALAFLTVLVLMTVRRMMLRSSKYPVFKAVVQALTVFLLVFLVCTEYDMLTLFIASASSTPDTGIPNGEQLLASNRNLPWSILIGLLSVGVFILGIVRKDVFLKNFSFVLFALVLIKLFTLDFATLSQGGKSGVFIVLGLFLIGVALVYPRLLKKYAKVLVTRRKPGERGAGKEERKKEGK
jgi:hypothetical protein